MNERDYFVNAEGYWTRRVQPSLERPVTGPDGDNPITDEQIRELWLAAELANDEFSYETCRAAMCGDDSARTRCAAAWNARQGGGR